MQAPYPSDIDWTGVQPERSPIEPLNEKTFIERLQRLSESARDIEMLRKALMEQSHGEQLPPNSEPTARPPR